MLFNSLTFLIFLIVVVAVYYSPIPWRGKKLHLLVSSYLFYAAWNPPFVILIWISTVIDWFAAKGLARCEGRRTRLLLLLASLCTNLGLLGFFKYGGFLLDNFIVFAGWLGIHYEPLPLDIVLPVGISFYTFQTLSYTIDVFRRKLSPSNSFLDFALFVTFFPQLVAGPIVRAAVFLPQLLEQKRATGSEFGWGACLLTIGLFEKVVLADSFMAPVADSAYGAALQVGFADAWVGTLAFSAQIFFDFAGYSTCAIGVAMLMGFSLPDNFRFPYAAIGFSDFWRRWHISLSSWLRDYLYIPLGGNRRGTVRTYVNLMTTMLLGGLWHGASWRFVTWGALHGLYLGVERWLGSVFKESQWTKKLLARIGLGCFTYLLVCITWVFFRAQSFSDAFMILQAMVGLRPDAFDVGTLNTAIVAAVTLGMLSGHWYLRGRTLESVWERVAPIGRAVILAVMLTAIVLSPGQDRAFIYFQF